MRGNGALIASEVHPVRSAQYCQDFFHHTLKYIQNCPKAYVCTHWGLQPGDFFHGEAGNLRNNGISHALFTHSLRHLASFFRNALSNFRVNLFREFLKDAVDHGVMVPFLVVHFLVCLEFFLTEIRYFRALCQAFELVFGKFGGEFPEAAQETEEKEPFTQVVGFLINEERNFRKFDNRIIVSNFIVGVKLHIGQQRHHR